MPTNWREYLNEKKKLADKQIQAQTQPTPAKKLAFYWSAIYPNWRVESHVVREMDEWFKSNSFEEMRDFSHHFNYLVAAMAKDMLEEIALRLAVENKELAPEQYKPAWWSQENA